MPIVELPINPFGQAVHRYPGCRLIQVVCAVQGWYEHFAERKNQNPCLSSVKARLHRRFLSQQLDAIFVALKLQLQNNRCKPGAICRRDIAGVSNMFKT